MNAVAIAATIASVDYLLIWCPGCKTYHQIVTRRMMMGSGPVWDWNGDVEKPTISPSILTWRQFGGYNEERCHSFVRDGVWEFLTDCTHELAGQSVPMQPGPNWPTL